MFQIRAKSNTYFGSYIVNKLTADRTDSWKMAGSSVLTVNERGEAFFVNVFVPNSEWCLRQNGKVIFIRVKKVVNIFSQFSSKEKKC